MIAGIISEDEIEELPQANAEMVLDAKIYTAEFIEALDMGYGGWNTRQWTDQLTMHNREKAAQRKEWSILLTEHQNKKD